MLFCIAFTLFGIYVATTNPKTYTSEIKLSPETESKRKGNLENLADMLGMDINIGTGTDAIYPEAYSDIIKSPDFITSLFSAKVVTTDKQEMTIYDFIRNHQKASFWTKLINECKRILPSSSNQQTTSKTSLPDSLISLTKEEEGIKDALINSIDCSVDRKTTITSLKVTTQDANVSAMFANAVKVELEDYITKYRIRKSQQYYNYSVSLLNDAKKRYEATRKAYADYCDSHDELILSSDIAKRDELENEMQLDFNILQQYNSQVNVARDQIQQNRPVFTTIQSPTAPIKASSTSRVVTILMYFVLGCIIWIMILLKWKKKYIFIKQEQII